MTKDELLAGFLDRSLSEDQMLDFQAIRSSDAGFDGQVQQMLKMEKVLSNSIPVVIPPADFLVAVESTVAAKVASGASASFFSGLMSSTWAWVSVGSAVAIGAGAIAITTLDSNNDANPVAQVPAEVVSAPAELVAPAITERTIAAPTSATADDNRAPLVRANAVERTSSSTIDPSRDVQPFMDPTSLDRSASSADVKASKEEQILTKVIADLQLCEERGDHGSCAQLSIEIGKKFREKGNMAEAQKYLNKALRHAQQSRIVSYEIDAFGQLGLTAIQAGQQDQARQYLTSAVELGESVRVDVSKWQDQLRSIK